MNHGIISKRYAKALWIFACEHRQEDRVYVESRTLSNSFAKYPALKRALGNRTLSSEKKAEMVMIFSGENVSLAFRQFIFLVINQKREELLLNICLDFQEICRHENKLLDVELVTAQPVGKEIEQQIVDKMEAKTGKTISLKPTTDTSIIGGYILTFGSYRVDASVARQLKYINEVLTLTI